jgi:hypothetical protein
MDVDAVVDGIAAGDFDGNLGRLMESIRKRGEAREDHLRWRITVGESVWDEDGVTIGEMGLVERIMGKSWAQIEPPAASASSFAAFVVAHFVKVDGMDFAAAIARAETITAIDAVQAVTQYEAVPPAPKDESAASTSS